MSRALLPSVEKTPEGAFVVRHVPPLMALALRQLPELLADDSPGIRRRLLGTPFPEDEEAARQWRRYAAPELEHLFAAARDLVVKDVAGIVPEPRTRNRFRVEIPAKHLKAWISSLAAVRVALGETHGFSEDEMEAVLPPVVVTERERAVLLVHVLGWVQGLLVEAGA